MPKYSQGRVSPGTSEPTTRSRFEGWWISSLKSQAWCEGVVRGSPIGGTVAANPVPYTSASRSLPYSTRTLSTSVSTTRQNSSCTTRASASRRASASPFR